jgi:hypothetical protein
MSLAVTMNLSPRSMTRWPLPQPRSSTGRQALGERGGVLREDCICRPAEYPAGIPVGDVVIALSHEAAWIGVGRIRRLHQA